MSALLQQSGIIAAIGFRLLLIVSLWQGPVVWGHFHSENGSSLADHLARFHQGETQVECAQWHWHVSFVQRGPAEGQESLPPGHPFLPQDLLSPVVVAPATSVSLAANLAPTVETACLLTVAEKGFSLQDDVYAASGFLSSYCPTHSSQDVLCRRLC